MKTSHYTTPRSMSEAHFALNADPMEYGHRPMHRSDKIVIWGCAVAAVALAVILGVWK